MGRQECEREDLLRQATGLVERVEFYCDAFAASIVFGFREQGALSLFLGPDEVYQFDSKLALRRGYWHGQLLKAQHGHLLALTRYRTEHQTILRRSTLNDDQQREYIERLQGRIERLRDELSGGFYRIVGEVSVSGDAVMPRVVAWLNHFPRVVQIAQTAGVR